jgi:hypothetical protein
LQNEPKRIAFRFLCFSFSLGLKYKKLKRFKLGGNIVKNSVAGCLATITTNTELSSVVSALAREK